MPNLERLVAEWRKSMVELGIGRRTLDELESHLLEEVDRHLRTGTPVAEAFLRAKAQLGSPALIASELRKLNPPLWLPLKLAIGFGIFLAVILAAFLASNFDGRGSTLVLKVHVWTVTLGYGGALLLGAIGICFVSQRCFHDFSQPRLESLKRASFIFTSLAAVLTAAGIGLGMIWSKAAWGRYWAWDAKETGAFCILAWLLVSTAIHRWDGISARAVLLLGLVGNIVVGLGWFGANLVARKLPFYGVEGLALITVVVAPSVFFFVAGLVPTVWLRSTKY